MLGWATKRVCQACEVPFYDLARAPIVCPSCGAQHTPAAERPPFVPGTSGASFTSKTGWRSKSYKPVAVPEIEPVPEVVATDDQAEETEVPAEAVAEDDIVLEQEPDDGDVSGLIDHDVEDFTPSTLGTRQDGL